MSSAELGQPLEPFDANLVETGRYNSQSEVLRAGVRLTQEREALLEALAASINRGLADAENGRTIPADVVIQRLGAKYRAMAGSEE